MHATGGYRQGMGTYRFDPAASRLDVHASSSLHGIDTGADGMEGELTLTLTAEGVVDRSAPVEATIRFALDRLRSGNPLEDVATERAIELKRYPEVEGRLTTIEPAGGSAGRYRVAGELTFHGVTRDVDGEIELTVADDGSLALVGEQVLDVRDWKVRPPRLGLLKVHPDIRVRLSATAVPADALAPR